MPARVQSRHLGGALVPLVVLLIVGAVAIVGGVHPVTQVALSAGALGLFVALVVWRGAAGLAAVPFALPAAVALGITALQLLPLPAGLVRLLSPHALQLRAEAGGSGFIPLTLDVPGTWLALTRGAACAGLLLVVANLGHSPRHARRLLWIPAGVGAALAVVAIAQRGLGVDRILGLYTPHSMPGFGVFGTFVNANHAASVLELGLLVAIGLALDASGWRRALATGCAVACGCTALVTTSRGAFVGLGIAGYLFAAVLILRHANRTRALIAATVLLALGLGTVLWANDGIRRKLSSPTEQVENIKTRGWLEGLKMAADYPLTGVGRGAFAAPIGAYRGKDEGVRLVYPENVLVQFASEWGFPATLVILGLALWTAWRLRTAIAKMPPAILGAACGVLAVAIHELFDFGLEFPGVSFPTVVTLALVVGAVRREQPTVRLRRLPLAALAAAWALTLGGAAWAARRTLDADWARFHAADQADSVDPEALRAAIARHPADDYLELIAARAALRHRPAEAMRHLNRALLLHPSNAQAHRLVARLLLEAKRPAQAALELRLAAASGAPLPPTELVRLLGDHVVDAVAATPKALQDLALQLYAIGKAKEADLAARRAVTLALDPEQALKVRTELALRFKYRPALLESGVALVRAASRVESFVLATQALAHAGDRGRTESVLAAGERAFPKAGALVVAGAQALLDLGDPTAARARLDAAGAVVLTLGERQQAAELLAQAAERTGDIEAAVMARRRAHLIARQLRDMNSVP